MTCIVGIADGKNVWLGGDSAAINDGYALKLTKNPKVFRKNEFIFGCCGALASEHLFISLSLRKWIIHMHNHSQISPHYSNFEQEHLRRIEEKLDRCLRHLDWSNNSCPDHDHKSYSIGPSAIVTKSMVGSCTCAKRARLEKQ